MFGYTTAESVKELSDEAIVARVQSEPWLFTAILERYQSAFLRKAKSIIFNEQDAEEVVQDAFTKIYMNAHKFEIREGAKFSSWGYTILINTALTRYQKCVKEGKRTLLLDPEFMEQFGEMKEHSAFNQDKDAIERVLARMPGHFARVLRLHYLEHWSHKDIADETGESVGCGEGAYPSGKGRIPKGESDYGWRSVTFVVKPLLRTQSYIKY
jgi:RNA polymerase sigma-70 factor (ECF subfamily)